MAEKLKVVRIYHVDPLQWRGNKNKARKNNWIVFESPFVIVSLILVTTEFATK